MKLCVCRDKYNNIELAYSNKIEVILQGTLLCTENDPDVFPTLEVLLSVTVDEEELNFITCALDAFPKKIACCYSGKETEEKVEDNLTSEAFKMLTDKINEETERTKTV